MAEKRGITILRLPPYHCELNPIELVWAQVKGEVRRNNVTFKLQDIKKLFEEALNKVTSEVWKKCVSHVIKEEEKMWIVDGLVDDSVEPLIISVNAEDTDADSDLANE